MQLSAEETEALRPGPRSRVTGLRIKDMDSWQVHGADFFWEARQQGLGYMKGEPLLVTPTNSALPLEGLSAKHEQWCL